MPDIDSPTLSSQKPPTCSLYLITSAIFISTVTITCFFVLLVGLWAAFGADTSAQHLVEPHGVRAFLDRASGRQRALFADALCVSVQGVSYVVRFPFNCFVWDDPHNHKLKTKIIKPINQKLRYNKELCEIAFLVKNQKNVPCRHGQIFRFGFKQIPVISWFQINTDETTEDILQCRLNK